MNLTFTNIIFQLGLLTGGLALFDPLRMMGNNYFSRKRSGDHTPLLRPNEAAEEDVVNGDSKAPSFFVYY